MKRTTNRLAGARLTRFLRAYFASLEEMDPKAAERTADACGQILASARVRQSAVGRVIANQRTARTRAPLPKAPQTAPETATGTETGTETGTTKLSPHQQEHAAPVEQPTPGAFDPYAFGLVPLFQTEGADAVRTKLDAVASVEQLRALARAQKIGLPVDIRRGDVDAPTVRDAIVRGVEKRIADRRAAAS